MARLGWVIFLREQSLRTLPRFMPQCIFPTCTYMEVGTLAQFKISMRVSNKIVGMCRQFWPEVRSQDCVPKYQQFVRDMPQGPKSANQSFKFKICNILNRIVFLLINQSQYLVIALGYFRVLRFFFPKLLMKRKCERKKKFKSVYR